MMTPNNSHSNSSSNTNNSHRQKQLSRWRWMQHIATLGERLTNWVLSLWPWLPWTLFVGMLPGLTIWQLIHFFQDDNLFQRDFPVQPLAILYPAISGLLYFGICYWVYRRRQTELQRRFSDFCQKINRIGTGLLVVPIFLFLRSHPISKEAPFFAMLLCTLTGVLAAVIAYGIPRLQEIFRPRVTTRHHLALLLVMALAAMWATAIIQMELVQHAALRTCDWDLGLYINTMWQTVHGNLLDCSLNNAGNHADLHFDPILILLSPVLLIYPGPESLIVLQGIWIAAGAVPMYLLASRHAKNERLGVVMAIIYLLHPAFHGPAMYDFHSLMLAGPLMLWCIHFLEAGAIRRFFVSLCLLLLTREDMSGIAFLIGLYAFISHKPRPVALATMLVSALYGLIIYVTIMIDAYSYSGYFKEMQGDHRSVVANIAVTAVTNPMYLLKYMLTEKKLIYISQLLVPMLFLPVFAPKHRVLYLGGLTITLLGTKDCLTNISMQYVTWWLPFLLAAVPTALDNVSKGRLIAFFKLDTHRCRTALIAGMLGSTIAMSAAFGAFLPNPSFRAGYDRLARHMRSDQWERALTVEKIKKMIPPDAKVMASQHLVPHFAIRKWIWSVDRNGYKVDEPDYAILWKRDLRSKKAYKVKARNKNIKILTDKTRYRRILKENDISVYKRIHKD